MRPLQLIGRAVAAIAALAVVTLSTSCGGGSSDGRPRSPAVPSAATLAEEPFLEKYSGQSLQELIALKGTYRLDSLILAIEGALDAKPEGGLSYAERVVLAVEALEREVNNGGYSQFFVNAPEYVPMIVSALEQIGCPQTAKITAGAIDELRLPGPMASDDVENTAAEMSEKDLARLDPYDERFYQYPDPIEERLFSFIEQHAGEIRLS